MQNKKTPIAEETIESKRSKKMFFLLFVVIPAFIPYAIRLITYFLHQEDLPEFFKGDIDLLCFCIGVFIGLYSEAKTIAGYYTIEVSVVYGMLTLILMIVTIFLSFSFANEYENIKYNTALIDCLKNGDERGIISTLKEQTKVEDSKNGLFAASIGLFIIAVYAFYKVILRK